MPWSDPRSPLPRSASDVRRELAAAQRRLATATENAAVTAVAFHEVAVAALRSELRSLIAPARPRRF